MHEHTDAVCLKGIGTDKHRPLMIFADYPDHFANKAKRAFVADVREFWEYILGSMSVSKDDVAFDYTVKCNIPKGVANTKAERAPIIMECNRYRFSSIRKVKPKAIVISGSVSLEAFTGKTNVGEYHESSVRAWERPVRDIVTNVWVCHSAMYAMSSPAATVPIFRTVFQAAQEAGLNPRLNPRFPNIRWKLKR